MPHQVCKPHATIIINQSLKEEDLEGVLMYLYKVALDMLIDLQISSTLMDLSACIFRAVITLGSVGDIGRRPPKRPRALAAESPALVRSWIRRLSNWAKAEKILKIRSPDAVVVSIAPSHIDLNPTPLPFSISIRLTSCDIDRPRRSRRQTIRVSPECNAERQSSRPGRFSFAPDALSVNMFSF